MMHATLCFPMRGYPPREILLGLKKVGFGVGKYNGFGGKVQDRETVARATARELEEETGLRVIEKDLWQVAHLTFTFPAKPDWDQIVHVFLTTAWEGIPTESREMLPMWFGVDELPFGRMWQDDPHWLPRVLAGERLRARFTFKADNETVDEVEIEPWDGYGLQKERA